MVNLNLVVQKHSKFLEEIDQIDFLRLIKEDPSGEALTNRLNHYVAMHKQTAYDVLHNGDDAIANHIRHYAFILENLLTDIMFSRVS